jgi:hypothetical protein
MVPDTCVLAVCHHDVYAAGAKLHQEQPAPGA